MERIRVRFAPSPTGHLHVGAARTALFNWLFARRHGGTFILRIEDTDFTRSSEEMTSGIIEGLKWLGLDWDEGPIYQSQRLSLYAKEAESLVHKGYAYYCYCLPQELQERKREASSRGTYWEYDRLCLNLSSSEREKFEREGRPRAIRFRVPEGIIEYHDLIHGKITVDCKNIEDFVLLRSDGFPTYHLSVVVDDIEQNITHVIRGDDHISNTPKQILLYQAFGHPHPVFAHLALILGPDRKKLSKRHGVTSVLQFREEGYLPVAILNFLAQMSWLPGDEENVYTLEEMVEKFSLEKLSKANPIFNREKLDWLNGKIISRMNADELAPYVKVQLEREGLWREELAEEKRSWFFKLIDLLKERSRRIRDFASNAEPFLLDHLEYDPEGVKRHLNDERLEILLTRLRNDFQELEEFSSSELEKIIRKRAEKEGVNAALLIHALRVLLLGRPSGPGIFQVLELMGKEKTLERMGRLQELRAKFIS